MALRDRIISLVGGKYLRQEREHNEQAFNTLYSAYQEGPFRMPPEMLAARLEELDSSTILNLIRTKQSSAFGFPYSMSTEDIRQYQVNASRQMWLTNPLAQWSIWSWTNEGMGEKVDITCNEESAQEKWSYTWENSRIFDADEIHEMSNDTGVDGEIYVMAFHSIADGSTIFETMNTDEVKDIIRNPENNREKLYYKREYTDTDNTTVCVYYPDYYAFYYFPEHLKKADLPSDAKIAVSEAMDVNNGTSVTILHIAHNKKDRNNPHGWPILGLAAAYFAAHKDFVESRLTVAKQKAMFTREITTSGGSRGVAAVKAKFNTQMASGGYTTSDSNPPAISGSSLIHNQAVEHRDLPMTTGAGDAKGDNEMFAWMALIGAGLFPTTAGMDTSRWATALAMDKNQSVLWSRYRLFWSAQFKKMVEITLLAAEKWGNAKFDDKTCTVSIDTLSLVDFPGVVPPIAMMIGTLPSSGLPENAQREIQQELWKPVLTALGAEDVDEILSDDMFGIVEPQDAKEMAEHMRELALAIRRAKIAEKEGQSEHN